MASILNYKQKRQAKATPAQLDYMVDYFIENPHVATGKFKSLQGRSDLTASWEHLVNELNRMGKGGRTKDVKSWKSTWRDNKSHVSQKVAKMRSNRAATGNDGGPPAKLTDREEKILGIIGFEYVEGVECPDAFPEEQSNAFELLVEGKEVPIDINGRNLILRDSPESSAIDDVKALEEGPALNLESDHQILTSTAASSEASPSGTLRNAHRRVPRAKKPSRERFSSRLENSRNDFAILAERQIACMEMFAKSFEKMAENDRQRNEIFEKLAVAIKDCVEHLKK